MDIEKVKIEEKFAHKYAVALPQAEFDKDFEARLLEVAPKIKMAGFRDGNVPAKVIREKHGDQIKREMLARIAQQAVKQILEQDKSLRPIGSPRVNVTKNDGNGIAFEVDIDTAPEVEIKDFSAMKIKRPQVEIPAKTIEDNLVSIARRTAPVEEVQRKSQKNDVLVMNYEGKIAEEENPSLKSQNYRIGLGDNVVHPDFEKNLENLAAGDKKEFSVDFPNTHTAKNVAGKTVAFSVEVDKVLTRKTEDFKVNEELAKRLKHKDLETLKRVVASQLESNLQPTIRQIIKRQIFDWFDKEYSFPLPQRLIEAEFADIWRRVENEMTKRKVEQDKFPNAEKNLRDQYRVIAERRLKTGLLLAEIAKQNGIAVNDGEILNSIKARIGKNPNAQQRQLLNKIEKNPQNVLAEVRPQVLEENVVEYILSKVSLENEKISLEDMLERAQELSKDTQLKIGESLDGEDALATSQVIENASGAGKKNKKK